MPREHNTISFNLLIDLFHIMQKRAGARRACPCRQLVDYPRADLFEELIDLENQTDYVYRVAE